MLHRNYDGKQNCSGCRFWSEMLARVSGEDLEAMCINKESPKYTRYTSEIITCEKWLSGHLGAVDQPGDIEEIITMYKEDDKNGISQ